MRLDRFNPYTSFGWFFIVGVICLVVGFACGGPKKQPQQVSTPVIVEELLVPIDDGNGVYYFPYTGEAYRLALKKFYGDEQNKDKRCSLQGFTEKAVLYHQGWQSGTAHTETTGFILHCRDVAVEAQAVTVP